MSSGETTDQDDCCWPAIWAVAAVRAVLGGVLTLIALQAFDHLFAAKMPQLALWMRLTIVVALCEHLAQCFLIRYSFPTGYPRPLMWRFVGEEMMVGSAEPIKWLIQQLVVRSILCAVIGGLLLFIPGGRLFLFLSVLIPAMSMEIFRFSRDQPPSLSPTFIRGTHLGGPDEASRRAAALCEIAEAELLGADNEAGQSAFTPPGDSNESE